MSDLYALDFDGVLCDSCGESSASALKAAKLHWPCIFQDVSSDVDEWILETMRTVRPVVETGYENLLLVRLLLELKVPALRSTTAVEGLTVDGLLANWETIKPVLMREWQQEKDTLVHLFGDFRDEWIKNDLKGWIEANRFYPGVADALRFAASKIYIVTTKQAPQTRFALALLKELAGIAFPEDHIYGLGSGPKVDVLKQLQARHPGATLHFVEDRLTTLRNVIKTPELDSWHLYLATWGYNTPQERAEAGELLRIKIVDLPDFCSKLR
eukprot:jgi/Mesen1/1647/ME000135S00642